MPRTVDRLLGGGFGGPLARSALLAALVASAGVATAALLAAAVRVLPWILDPDVPREAAAPFARTLATLAVEVAILVGWPVGWSLAVQRLAERGEARALAALGERPARTLARLGPQGALLAALLALAAAAGGRDARAPGRVVRDLVGQTRAACARVGSTATYAVPLVGATWLCAPGRAPRLVGRGPGALEAVVYTAADAHVSDDLRRIDLADAHLALPPPGGAAGIVHAHVAALSMRGLPALVQAASLPPGVRAAFVAATGAGAAALAVLALLGLAARRSFGRLVAVVTGASGPLAALALVRGLERSDAAAWWFALAPALACAAPLLVTALLGLLPRSAGRAPAANTGAST